MAISSIEYQALLNRVQALESAYKNVITALSKLVTVDQVTQLGLLRQTEAAEHTIRLTGVENRLGLLESYHRT